jgi:steroid delta-isomerase-like uncharacterized protein
MKNLIQRYYDLFNSGDREALLELLSDDVVHEINEGGEEVGIESFRKFLEKMDRSYQEQVEQLIVFSNDNPNRAAAEFFIRGKYIATDEGLPEATGQPYHLRIGAFFEITNGKISRITNFYNLAAPL